MLHGSRIEDTLIGGPAFGIIMKGDMITKVDGVAVRKNYAMVLDALRGSDIPGSTVAVTVHRQRKGFLTCQGRKYHLQKSILRLQEWQQQT